MTLAALALEAGTTLEALASSLDLQLAFLQRVDTGFQPLPLDLTSALGFALGVDPNEVKAAVPRLTINDNLRTRQPRPLPIDNTRRAAVYTPTLDVAGADLVFNPRSIVGMQLFGWYRSDSGIVLSGSDVTDVGDKSFAGNNLTEPARRPTWMTGGVEDLPFIRFTTAGFDELDFAGTPTGATGADWTFIFAVNPTTISGSDERAIFDVNNSGSLFALGHEVAGGTSLGYYNAGVWRSIAAATTGMQILAFVFDALAGEGRVYRNKVLLGTATYIPFDVIGSGGTISIGGSLTVLGGFNTADMDLYEAAFYGQPIDTQVPDQWDRLHDEYFFPRYSLP